MISARVQALAGLAALLMLAGLALWLARPTPPKPADAPVDAFSALRAIRHVEALSERPHPMATRAHARARAYVVNELRLLGWQVEVDSTWVRKWRGPLLRYARLFNIVARRPEAAAPPSILLVSHYDSVPSGPGAGDASAPVAAILEALRALGDDPAARSLGILITDGEEAGLLGAGAFAERHPWMSHVELVLNFEARGNAGVPWMFETGYGAARLVRVFGRAVPRPFANSLSAAIYRRMPNDTDYSVFRQRGIQGLNFAMIGNHPAYHSQLDTADNLDRGSLQTMGDAVLGLARAVPSADWRRTGTQPTYFNPLGSWFVLYPVQIDQAVLVIGIFLAGMWLWGRAAGLTSGIVFALGAWGGTVVAVSLSWWLLIRMFPAVVEAPNGAPYNQLLLILGWLLLGLAVMSQFAGWIRRDTQAAATGLVLLIVVGVTSVAQLPDSTYMVSWPLLALSVAAWLTVVDPSRKWLWWVVGAVPVPLLYAPFAREVLLGLTPHGAWLVAGLIGVGSFSLLPLLSRFGANDASWRWVLAAVGVVLILASGILAGADSETPRPLRLAYALTDRGEPLWISRAEKLDPWLEEAAGSDWLPSDWQIRELNGVGDLGVGATEIGERRAWVATAPEIAELAGPQILHLATGEDADGRWLDVEMRTVRGGQQLWMTFSGAVVSKVLWLGGESLPVDDGPVRRLLMLAPRPSETLRLWAEGTTPVWISAYELTYGLPGSAPPIPDYLIPSSSWTDFSVRVGSRAAVDDRAAPSG